MMNDNLEIDINVDTSRAERAFETVNHYLADENKDEFVRRIVELLACRTIGQRDTWLTRKGIDLAKDFTPAIGDITCANNAPLCMLTMCY